MQTSSRSDVRPDDYFKLLADNSSDLICRIQPGGMLSYVSPSSARLLGWAPEEMVGRNVQEFIYPEDYAVTAPLIAKLITRELEEVTTDPRAVRKDGSLFWSEANVRMVWDAQTKERSFAVLVLRDISEHKRLKLQLRELARRDGLTGLMNRRGFDEALEQEWGRHLREAAPLSLLLLDVDRFKAFNDQYGHQVGDDCLRAIGTSVEGAIRRPADRAARYGGEELAVILPNTDTAGAMVVAEHVRAAVEALRIPHGANTACGWVTISVGVATALVRAGGTMEMPSALLAAADVALYKAKNLGRNRVETALVLIPAQGSSTR